MKLTDMKNSIVKRYTALVLASLTMIFALAAVWGYGFGYNLSIDGVVVGSFGTEEEAVMAVEALKEEGIDLSERFEIRWGKNENGFTDIKTATDNYKKTDNNYEHGFLFSLNGEFLFAVSSEEDALNIQNEVLAMYDENGESEVFFIGDLECAEGYAEKDAFKQKKDAFEMLKESVMVESVVKTVSYEAIPYETEILKDETLYVDEEIVETEGKDGKKHIEFTSHKINGTLDTEEFTGDFIDEEAESRVVRKGTKTYVKGEATGEFKNPSAGYISSYFGPRWGRMHKGIDVAAPTGTPIYASDGGEVIYSDWMSGYGYLVIIDHKNGYTTYYAHCSKLHVGVGTEVAKGELIADMGSTGNSTGPHLHFEVRLDNVHQNPINFVNY